MPDICMCYAKKCDEDKKCDCYRYNAIPSCFQSYSDFSLSENFNDGCDFFIKNKVVMEK